MNFPLPASTMTSCHQRLRPFPERYPDYKNFRIFESTTVQILDEVAQGHSEIGIIYLNNQNKRASCNGLKSLV